jgi:GT2 family glycosyltransferase
MLISLIVLNWNRVDWTRRALETAMVGIVPPYEVVLVDNGSVDGTREYLQAFTAPGALSVKLVLNEQNLGAAGGRNSGLYVAAGDLLMLLDCDTLLPATWATEIREAVNCCNEHHLFAFNVEPHQYPVISDNGVTLQSKAGVDHSLHNTPANLGTAAMCIPRRTFERIGYFCTDYGQYGYEDVDYCCRLDAAGLRYAYLKSRARHLPEDLTLRYRALKTEVQSHYNKAQELLYENVRRYNSSRAVYLPYSKYDPATNIHAVFDNTAFTSP